MKIPLSWIKEYIDINISPEDIANTLTMAGLEVDSIEQSPLPYQKVIVGKVLSTKPHPNADSLCVAEVSDGKQQVQVVCGAPNCRAGMTTAYATIGASISIDGKTIKIKKSKIRGVESRGMLCSEMELGLSQESEGIIELPENLTEGVDLQEIYGDVIFEISLTPNLGHCTSILGIARELSATTSLPLKPQKHLDDPQEAETNQQAISVVVKNTKHCPRYSCKIIENVVVRPSPPWLQRRMESCGFRSINVIVDITNLVLMEFGQPLHAFDYDKFSGKKLIIQDAKEGDSFQTLDNEIHTLNGEALLICDEEKPLALAGIMGGLNSEVGESTKTILLESAFFHPNNIRKTSKALGIQTEASKRFERGCDPNNTVKALNKASSLIKELCNASPLEGYIDIKEKSFKPWPVTCRYTRANAVLGTQLALSEIEDIFKRLSFHFDFDGEDLFTIYVPTHRNDIHSEIDLIEEIARIYGYDNIEAQTASYQSSSLPHSPLYPFENRTRSHLTAEGLQEFLTCDLISPSQIANIVDKDTSPHSIVKVLNPTSIEQSVLRPSLLPGLLQVVKYNQDHQNHNLSGFEIGKVHFLYNEKYTEQSMAAIILTGEIVPHHWETPHQASDFFHLKGLIENQLAANNIQNYLIEKSSLKSLHPGRQASISIDNKKIGSMGEVHPRILRKLDITQKVFFAELNLHDLLQFRKSILKIQELPSFPGSQRDWTISISVESTMKNLLSTIKNQKSKLLQKVIVLDIYKSEQIKEGFNNITLRFTYLDKRKTLSQKAVESEHSRITQQVLLQLGEHILDAPTPCNTKRGPR